VNVGFHLHRETLWTLAAKLQGAIGKQFSAVCLLKGNEEAAWMTPRMVARLYISSGCPKK